MYSRPKLKITCEQPIFFLGAQMYFHQLGFDWKAAWKGMLMEFSSNGTQWLYLHEDKTFGWSVKGEARVPEYTKELYKKLFK